MITYCLMRLLRLRGIPRKIEIQTEKEIEGKVIPEPPHLAPSSSTPEPFTKSVVVLVVLLFIMSLPLRFSIHCWVTMTLPRSCEY
jgi:hypothetical protein